MDNHHNNTTKHTSDSITELSKEPEAIIEIDLTVNRNSCAVYGCSTKSMTRCNICVRYYCAEHLHFDLHNLNNMGIINQLKNYLSKNNPKGERLIQNINTK